MGLGDASARHWRLCSDLLLAPISWMGADIWGWTETREGNVSWPLVWPQFTVDIELDCLPHGRRDSVGGDTHVGSHLTPGHLVQLDLLPLHLLNCNDTFRSLPTT